MLNGLAFTLQVTSLVGISHAVPSGMPATDLAEQSGGPSHRIQVPTLQMHFVSICKVVHRHAEQMAGLSRGVRLHNRLRNSGHSMLDRSPCAGHALAGH